MRPLTFWKAVTADREGFLERFIELLHTLRVSYCLVGGQAVNAYAEPVVSLDLDVIVATEQLDTVTKELEEHFVVERFSHSIHVSAPESSLRVQIQTDPRYLAFLPHSVQKEVLGVKFPVARPEDVMQGKIWAASDPTRRPSKRQKDLADIARLLEVAPSLRQTVPEEILSRLL